MQWVFTFNAVGAAIPFALFRNTFWVFSCDRACCAASEAWPSPRAPRGLTVASGKCPDLKRMKSQLQTIFHVSYHALPYRCTCVFTIHFGGSWNWFYITDFRWKCILFWKSDIWNFQNWLDGSMKNIFSLSDSRHCTSYGRESFTGGGWGIHVFYWYESLQNFNIPWFSLLNLLDRWSFCFRPDSDSNWISGSSSSQSSPIVHTVSEVRIPGASFEPSFEPPLYL